MSTNELKPEPKKRGRKPKAVAESVVMQAVETIESIPKEMSLLEQYTDLQNKHTAQQAKLDKLEAQKARRSATAKAYRDKKKLESQKAV